MPLYRRPGSDNWWVRIGRKTRKSTGTADRVKAEEFEAVLTERLWRVNKLGDRGAVSWKEASERWLNESRRARKRDREFLVWLAHLNEEPVSAVADPEVVEQLRQDGLACGWSQSTVDRMMRTVRAVLRSCVRYRYIEAIPHIPMYGEAEAEPRFLTPAEFSRLCAELPPHLSRAARFAVLTLLRMRSQSRLMWSRVDLPGRRCWVPKSNMKGGRTFGFPLSAEALAVLVEERKANPKSERVFAQDNFNTAAFRKAAERAGLKGLRWHDLRHTGASWAVQSGVTLQELMVLGDWKSYRMVLRYAHLAPSNAASAAASVGTSVAQALRQKRRKAL